MTYVHCTLHNTISYIEHIILYLCFIANNIYKYYSFELFKTIFIINM